MAEEVVASKEFLGAKIIVRNCSINSLDVTFF
jgi:hypothetical protein